MTSPQRAGVTRWPALTHSTGMTCKAHGSSSSSATSTPARRTPSSSRSRAYPSCGSCLPCGETSSDQFLASSTTRCRPDRSPRGRCSRCARRASARRAARRSRAREDHPGVRQSPVRRPGQAQLGSALGCLGLAVGCLGAADGLRRRCAQLVSPRSAPRDRRPRGFPRLHVPSQSRARPSPCLGRGGRWL